jgi:type I site-specific restriction endonuclease
LKTLNLPAFEYKIKTEGQRTQIFDRIRRKYVALTPEEWVRQHIVNFLSEVKKYPLSLMKLETGLKYNQMNKRTDLILCDSSGKPSALVECKAPEVAITQKTFEQAALYNSSLKAELLIVTNGLVHYCCRINHETGKTDFLDDIPEMQQHEI